MEEAAKTVEDTFKPILPIKPHALSAHPTRKYRPPHDPRQLEEQVCRPLQYTTFVSDADRGVLLARAYFDIREEDQTNHATSTPATSRPSDPKKPKTKLSLKDYQNRKKSPEGDSPPKPRIVFSKDPDTPHPPEGLAKSGMDIKKERGTTNPGSAMNRLNSHRQRSHSPDRPRKRPSEATDLETKPVKRVKAEEPTHSPSDRGIHRPMKPDLPKKPERVMSHERKPSNSLKPSPLPNGKTGMNNSIANSSPKTNGSQKFLSSNNSHAVKRPEYNSSNKSFVPPLLSPLRLDHIDDKPTNRPSPKKRPDEAGKHLPRKPREDREPSPLPRKRKLPLKVPPLLSPTLPAIVMEELAKAKKMPASKDSPASQKGGQASDSQSSVKKAARLATQEETIHVDSRRDKEKEKIGSHIIVLKYKKKHKLTVERILRLEPKGKRIARDRSDSLEPGVARKRPRAATETGAPEAAKRPRTSENLQPSTPLNRQSTAMTRVASSSSQVGTPGVSTNMTPATHPPEPRRSATDPEQVQRLFSRSSKFITLGTRLKHERDAISRPKEPNKPSITDRDHYAMMAAGTQSLLSYMLGFKLENDARDIDRKTRNVHQWKSLQPLFRVIKNDCARHPQISTLLLRIQGILLVFLGRALCTHPENPDIVKDLIQNSKDQQDVWRMADKARKSLGVFDGTAGSDESGDVGRLLDRLGPWTNPEEAIPIALEILRKTMRPRESWRPAEELTRIGRSTTNGV